MAKYMVKVKYTQDGLKGLLKDGGTARVEAVNQLLKSVGGTVESFYFAFGAEDGFVVLDVPDVVSAAALSLTVGAAGGASVEVIQLLTPAEIDAASKKSPAYRAPGQ
ncbi:MAG TPA: GYD domain-containing protein [Dehalococcoidia bacterium]|nr:GYD domain-containing protein [Dehalococcoidia bacterium]